MAGVGIVIVGLDVADAAVIVLKLTLHDEVGVIVSRQLVAGDLAIERDLEVLVAGLSDRNVIGVEPQWEWPRFCACHSILTRLRLPEDPRNLRENRILAGRADPARPVTSHVDLLGNCQGVIDLDAEVAHRALNFRMAQ